MKFLVVDDHELIREGLRVVLARIDGGVELVEASSVATGLQAIREEDGFDLAIFDMMLPDGSGARLMDELGRVHPEVPVIVVSAEIQSMEEAFRHGAMGFIPKSSLSASLLTGIQEVLKGEIYVPTSLAPASSTGASAGRDPFWSRTPRSDEPDLTERQKMVLSLMMRGLTNKSICRELDLAESTVKIHVSAILRALQVKSRTQAVLTAARMNIV